jgi:DNA (cytosine-5)-methyltransferase 1
VVEEMTALQEYKFVSLFSGAGGMDAGLEATGAFRAIACVENDPASCETLRINRDHGRLGSLTTEIFERDVSHLDPFLLMDRCHLRSGELTLLAGGPPCQSFSTAGRRGTIQDPRGTLLWQFLRYVVALQPTFFIMENVRGLLSAAIRHRPIASRPNRGGPELEPEERPGSVVDLWVHDLLEMTNGTYRVDCFEVNAVNYGAPQLRERVLFVGNRIGRIVEMPEPTHGDSGYLEPFATLGEALARVAGNTSEILDFSPRKKWYLGQVPEGANWRALPPDLQQESMGKAWYAKGGRSGWWRRLTRDLPCPTVVTLPNHASTSMCHPTETRALSITECAAVQEFPEGWQFSGTTAEKYRQVGNALPVRLGTIVGRQVAIELATARTASNQEQAPAPYRRVYIKSHVRTRQWYRDGVTYVWTAGTENNAQYRSPVRHDRVASA